MVSTAISTALAEGPERLAGRRAWRVSTRPIRVGSIAALAIALTACSGSSDPSDGTTGNVGAISSTAEPSAAPATEAATADEDPTTTLAPTTTTPPSARTRLAAPEVSTIDGLLALERPIVIAHAGGDFESPHSTMYGFTQAALAGADVLEMDVMLTKDHVLVVQHDDTVDRTTQATGPVRDLDYAELSGLDNAYWFSGGVWSDHTLADDAYMLRGVRTGERPPPDGYGPDDFRVETFRSVAMAFPDHVLDIEIKIPHDAAGEDDIAWAIEGAQALATEIAELGRTDSVIVVSFDAEVLTAFRQAAPGVATSPGLSTLVGWYGGAPTEFAPTDRVFQVPPFYQGVEVLTADVIARAQAEGFDVWVWMDDTTTQENSTFYTEMLTRGVDGLLASRPAEALQTLRTPG